MIMNQDVLKDALFLLGATVLAFVLYLLVHLLMLISHVAVWVGLVLFAIWYLRKPPFERARLRAMVAGSWLLLRRLLS